MATTKIKVVKSNIKYTIEYTTDKEKTAKELKKSIAYIDNAIKNQGQFIFGLHCVPQVADIQFKAVKEKFNKKDKNLGYHVIQSFAPNEITPEKAHQIGIELAKRITNDRHQAVISTHLDKAHIHNHIVFNSVSHVDGKKWYNWIKSYKIIRNHSDALCKEHGLSIVDTKNEKAMHYKEWAENKKGNSWKAHIKQDIDKVIKESKSWNEFLDKMKANGYEIKHGKYISFKPKGKERFVRGKTLGSHYTQDNIQTRIKMASLGITMPKRTFKVKRFNRMPIKIRSIHLVNIILIIKILKTIRSRADRYNYTPLDKRYNTALVKQLSKSLIICKKENIDTYQKLTTKLEQNRIRLNDVRRLIKSNESINKVDKGLYNTYYELMEKDKIYKKLKSDLDNANKEIRKTHKQKEQDITKIIKKDLGLSR